ncbi:M12 family metallo-peptidase [Epilithonimonas caeni]|uniref:M12 family metallo-peptidase n=1 Tax=Epilithonimonas caeni TaxID=365343 RepID=UPI0004893EF0|nr:M12 family metallo-peptidase [Epilithonimonas caeni]
MKKKLQLFVFLLLSVMGFAQTLRPIAKEVNDYHSKKAVFQAVNLFSLDNSGRQIAYQQAARDARVLKLDKSKLSQILLDRPQTIEFTFPFEDRELVVEMVKVDIYSPEFKVETNKKKVYNYQKGVFYRGIVKGDNKSVVAFSFFDNDVIGVASAPNIGNVTLGKAVSSEDFVVYNDQKLTGTNPFICAADELMDNERQKIKFDPKTSKAPQMTNSCVRVYYEICNQPFQQNGSNVTNTVNWISAVHNNINTLYVNDGVKMSLKTVYVWETADPYTGSYSQNLAAFRVNRPTFDGDLAHLVNYPSTTSVAYLNSLCGTYKYAYSGINMTYNNVPTYSWTIMAMTHEMGHALGSPHTHACAWNGDSTPIDGCGALAGYPESGCDEIGPIPSQGGTIMSYCHLNSVGINMSLGFGEQPGALIRQTVDSKACLGTDCTNVCTITVTSLVVSNVTKTAATATISDATSSLWKYRVVKMDGTIVKSGNTAVKTLTIDGLSPNTFYKVEVGTDCSGAYQRSQMILTDDDWCGKTITDSGGANANYTDNETWTKTFYPDSSNGKIKITFQEFDLEQGYDFLTVRNGPSTTSPAFTGSTNMSGTTIRGPFESTHATGAITVTFTSDEGVTSKGFKALLSCGVLAADDVAGLKDVSLSPNPVKDRFILNNIGKIVSVKVFDTSGKLIKDFDEISISKNMFDVSMLKTGSYVVMVKTDKETISKKIIKK